MKKVLSIFISAAMLATLSSCGVSPEQNQENQNGVTQTEYIDSTSVVCQEFYDGKFQLTKRYGHMLDAHPNAVDTMYGLMSSDGTVLLDCIYSKITVLNEHRIVAQKSGEGGATGAWIIDENGSVISDNQYFSLEYKEKNGTDEYLPIGIGCDRKEYSYPDVNSHSGGNYYFLVDFDGNKILDTPLCNVKFNDDMKTISVTDGFDKSYVVDFKGNKVE
ncbi:MAG: hypothetical protein UH824_07470 [Acutalibacteraceae bacterium]|nr:hypothetical protein [Acutalibacteraceae bacterium]